MMNIEDYIKLLVPKNSNDEETMKIIKQFTKVKAHEITNPQEIL